MPTQRRLAAPGRVLGWALAGLLATQAALSLTIQYVQPGFADPTYEFKAGRLRQRLRAASPDAPLVLMLGSSRTAFGLDAVQLETDLGAALGRPVIAFNFGVAGAGPVGELLHFRKLLADGVKPDLLLVEVMPPLLAAEGAAPLEARWFPIDSRLRRADLAVLDRYGMPTRELRWNGWLSWVLPAWVHRQALLSRVAPSWLPYAQRLEWIHGSDSAGWAAQRPGQLGPSCRLSASELDQKRYGNELRDFAPGRPATRALGDLLEECRRSGIPAVLVLMPEGSEFRGYYSRGTELAVLDLLKNLGDRTATPVIDARRWLNDDAFFDGHHLHAEGARLFSRRLWRDVVAPRFR